MRLVWVVQARQARGQPEDFWKLSQPQTDIAAQPLPRVFVPWRGPRPIQAGTTYYLVAQHKDLQRQGPSRLIYEMPGGSITARSFGKLMLG
jgi:hypothetical protein